MVLSSQKVFTRMALGTRLLYVKVLFRKQAETTIEKGNTCKDLLQGGRGLKSNKIVSHDVAHCKKYLLLQKHD